MLKRLLYIFIVSLFLGLPAFAGVYEDAMKTNNYLLLYLYSARCKYCVRFEPVYHNLARIYGNKCKFIKVDAVTPYGQKLMMNFNGTYVPYVIMRNNINGKTMQIEPGCLLEKACVDYKVKNFLK